MRAEFRVQMDELVVTNNNMQRMMVQQSDTIQDLREQAREALMEVKRLQNELHLECESRKPLQDACTFRAKEAVQLAIARHLTAELQDFQKTKSTLMPNPPPEIFGEQKNFISVDPFKTVLKQAIVATVRSHVAARLAQFVRGLASDSSISDDKVWLKLWRSTPFRNISLYFFSSSATLLFLKQDTFSHQFSHVLDRWSVLVDYMHGSGRKFLSECISSSHICR
jgi:hypothetical protein